MIASYGDLCQQPEIPTACEDYRDVFRRRKLFNVHSVEFPSVDFMPDTSPVVSTVKYHPEGLIKDITIELGWSLVSTKLRGVMYGAYIPLTYP
jgi:hypothetical protein